MTGFAVVDVETTGFSYRRGHRIIEIGVVELSPDGEIEGSWETLINPHRHIEATEVHGITAADVFGAPSFEQISDKLAQTLNDRLLVAHNATFDGAFLREELHRCGRCEIESLPAIDTMRLARTHLNLPKSRLSDCCAHLGITNELAHSALADALATAQLFQHFLWGKPGAGDSHIAEQVGAHYRRELMVVRDGWSEPPLHSRRMAAEAQKIGEEGGWFAELISDRSTPSNLVVEEYFGLLDAALLDRRLSASEQAELLGFAKKHGLGEQELRDLHEAYLTLLLEKAWEDGRISDKEKGTLYTVARVLGIPREEISPALAGSVAGTGRHRSAEKPGSCAGDEKELPTPGMGGFAGITLHPGDRVTVTGAKKYSNADWAAYLAQHGVELGGLAKKTKVLVAADPDSQSGKATKAKAYGIPIVAEDVARDVIRFAS